MAEHDNNPQTNNPPQTGILVFSRFPVPGETKTRLIPALGSERAARLHRRMGEHAVTVARTAAANEQIAICYTGAKEKNFRAWLGPDLNYYEQFEGTLGRRMSAAFADLFVDGMDAVIGFGTDIPGITPAIVIRARADLATHDIVIGPAADGGYYLIGMKRMHPELFGDLPWGTADVYRQTREICTELGLSVAELPVLHDIDRPEDLELLAGDPDFADCLAGPTLLSVVIPTLNEAENLGRTLTNLKQASDVELIVADGGSQDATAEIATSHGARLLTISGGRAAQLNAGATAATGRQLLFLHADTLLPVDYAERVRAALDTPATVAGAFRFKTDASGFGMRLVEWGTNLRSTLFQTPYGDQGLFMEMRIFGELGGFPPLPIMEDFELVRRLRRRGRIVTLKAEALTSARRWQRLGVLRTFLINQLMIAGYLFGVPNAKLQRLYRGKPAKD
ncbi:MAG: hypothetical protein C0622_08240 [Desulfuromonas sp.]|nr:MAG: hypothetical protein C0622_08240 [Desulfuromonas sp.]